MRVFKVKHDSSRYQYFLPADTQCKAFTDLDGTSKSDVWSPPAVYIAELNLKAGSFFNFDDGYWIMDPAATSALGLLELAGELLPLPHNGTLYTLLNVTECVDCLDHEQTTFVANYPGDAVRIDRYAFKDGLLPMSPIFKIPEEDKTSIFYVEGQLDPTVYDVRKIVRQGALKGLLFEKVWSNEDAAEQA